MIDSSVTLDIYAAATVIEVQNTSAEKAIYLLSDSPLDDVRQYVVMETLPDTDVIAQVPYQVWHLVDDSFTPMVIACEILDCEDPEHVLRMMRCIGYYLGPDKGRTIPGKEKIIDQLKVLVKYSDDPEIVDFAAKLISALEKEG